jgi:hypothetical protein
LDVLRWIDRFDALTLCLHQFRSNIVGEASVKKGLPHSLLHITYLTSAAVIMLHHPSSHPTLPFAMAGWAMYP